MQVTMRDALRSCFGIRGAHPPRLAATAAPGVADPVQPRAPELYVVGREPHRPHLHVVTDHTEQRTT